MAERKLPNPLTCRGCSKPLPGSKGTVAFIQGTLKCRECVRREVREHRDASR